MQHVIDLTDSQEDALAWAANKSGASLDDTLLQWIDAVSAAQLQDLNSRLDALKGLSDEKRAIVKNAMLGRLADVKVQVDAVLAPDAVIIPTKTP